MTINFLLTVNAGPFSAANDGSHPSFQRLCKMVDGHGIPATWMIDEKLMTNALTGFTGRQGYETTTMTDHINSMTTPQDMAFVDHAIGVDKGPRPVWDSAESHPPGPAYMLKERQFRHLGAGAVQTLKFRRNLHLSIHRETDFHLVLDSGFLLSTNQSCRFLENILFNATEHMANGRVKFALIKEFLGNSTHFAIDRQISVA